MAQDAKANTVEGGGSEKPADRSDLINKWCYCLISNALFYSLKVPHIICERDLDLHFKGFFQPYD